MGCPRELASPRERWALLTRPLFRPRLPALQCQEKENELLAKQEKIREVRGPSLPPCG